MDTAIAAAGPHKGFGAYIHWPFCAKICPYCDFNVYTAGKADPEALLAALCLDIERHKSLLPLHPVLNSIYLGGGTPSLLTARQIGALIDTCRAMFGVAEDLEVTLEANPNDILRSNLADWKAVGVTRLSIGVQALSDSALSFLGRDHTSQVARQALEQASKVFSNLSADMIYARPDQSLDDWTTELSDLLSYDIRHVSLYELTISENTAFGRAARRGTLQPMPDDAQADLYEATNAIMEKLGFPAYEISNHASAAAWKGRHNEIYWACGDWLGIGPGAHGRLTLASKRVATQAVLKPAQYIEALNSELPPWVTEESLSDDAIGVEALSMGLRPISGVAMTPIEASLGRPLNQDILSDLRAQGLVGLDQDRLFLSPSGRILADHITKQLLTA